MKAARILVLGVALAAGGAAAFLVGSDEKKPEASAPAVQQLPTVDVLIARGDIGMGMGVAVSADNFAWQTEEERDDRGRAEISLSGTA